MGRIVTVGLDIAKSVFQVHGVDEDGKVVERRQLKRSQMVRYFGELPPALIGIEACGTAHHWARQLAELGHEVRLIPPAYVKPYVKRQKNDAADAEAICEAVMRPSMRFVAVKSVDQQAAGVLHKTRALLIKQRTMMLNAVRAHLAEFGVVTGAGITQAIRAVAELASREDLGLPDVAREALGNLAGLIQELQAKLTAVDKQLTRWHYQSDVSNLLETIPGVGIITASALVSSVTEPNAFKSARHFAAWLGLVPKQNSSGGKTRLGRITKGGNRYLRQLLVVGATAVLRHARAGNGNVLPWIKALLDRRPPKVVAVALANKMARIAWVVMTRGVEYERRELAIAA
ncbi:IS110 family transposase [Sphingobium sp. LB126]|uniref:IS110 family transposase n=1 Tax=Sphingobium sp. LB126 TaxID=1983755 RepID=UPI000C200D7E|nr:IS110 family transposase [Sphingobium sp. LB126]PJG44982.1 IS110 family transposase [Sphingobium sp. LB126]